MAERTTSAAQFDAFVRPHLQAMWTLASRLVGPQQREDVVQDALFLAWRRRSTYDASRGTTPTWLISLVMGCAVGTVSGTLSDARRSLRARLEVPT